MTSRSSVHPTIVAARTAVGGNWRALAARQHYPQTPIRGELAGDSGLFDCAKAERMLGWRHGE